MELVAPGDGLRGNPVALGHLCNLLGGGAVYLLGLVAFRYARLNG